MTSSRKVQIAWTVITTTATTFLSTVWFTGGWAAMACFTVLAAVGFALFWALVVLIENNIK